MLECLLVHLVEFWKIDNVSLDGTKASLVSQNRSSSSEFVTALQSTTTVEPAKKQLAQLRGADNSSRIIRHSPKSTKSFSPIRGEMIAAYFVDFSVYKIKSQKCFLSYISMRGCGLLWKCEHTICFDIEQLGEGHVT